MEVTILISSKGKIHKSPVLTFRGLPVVDIDEFEYGLEEAIYKTAKTFSLGSKKQEYNLIDALKIVCRKYTKEMTGKRPFTNINLVQI
jgi:ribonuclease J